MGKLNWRKRCYAVVLLCAATAIALRAQTFTTLHSFDNTDGQSPWAGLVQATDGNLYGTTYAGGANNRGTVFKITPTGTPTTLYSFCSQSGCADGANPYAGLVQATDGNLYGTTYLGGGDNAGTVFKITTDGSLTTLYSFCPQFINCPDGATPSAGLVQATDGNFYGTTYTGGLTNNGGGNGTVFTITPGGTLTTLYSFCSQSGCADGANPYAGLVQATDGNFYGTTTSGAASAYGGTGTVFKITPGGALTTLYSFCSQSGCADGQVPYAGLVQATDGTFYGTTNSGGANNLGTVFKITPSSALTTLHSFCSPSDCSDGSGPYSAALIQATDGNLYGTTPLDGGGIGNVFKITPSGTLTTLYSFCSQGTCTDGRSPVAALVQDTHGTFYGTTLYGGTTISSNCPYGCGTVFSLSVGLAPSVTLAPTSLAFGNQPVTITSGAMSITLTNSGGADLSISGITPSGDFAQTNNCPLAPNTLAAGAPCTINVTFTPTATGIRSGAITITDNASNSPQSVSLSGNGTDFSVSATPATQTVKAPKSATYTLSVAPISGFTGTVALGCSGAPAAATCTVSPASVTLGGTTAATVTVATSPGKKGTPKGTYTLTLTGSYSTLSHSTTVTLTVR